jgi:integrase
MLMIFFSSAGWQDWDVQRQPLIREGMPILVDDDLAFEDEGGERPAAVANRWLQQLPVSGVAAPSSWQVYARALRGWLEFVNVRGAEAFGSRDHLRAVLSAYAEHRLAGPVAARVSGATWNLQVGVLAQFYAWAVEEAYASAVPFTYGVGRRLTEGRLVEVRRNLAKVRGPQPHTRIKYLEWEFVEMFVRALEGLLPDGSLDPAFRGLNPGRDAAAGKLVLSSGLRRREFTYLLVHEVPPLPSQPCVVPIQLPVPGVLAKGNKYRTTWASYEALAAVHRYCRLERRLAIDGSPWRPDLGEPLVVTEADRYGGVLNGQRRVAWAKLTPSERLRLVDAGGGSLLLWVQRSGAPFVDWATVFRRVSARIRSRFDARFPHVKPHRLRHTFAMATLELLITGYYQQAAKLVADTGDAAAMALYLTKADPLLILRDLLGHASVSTTEIYVSRLDATRIFRDAYPGAGTAGLSEDVFAELADEFGDEFGDDKAQVMV